MDKVRRVSKSVYGVALTTKSGTVAQQKRAGGNCYNVSVVSKEWVTALKGVRVATKFLKEGKFEQ